MVSQLISVPCKFLSAATGHSIGEFHQGDEPQVARQGAHTDGRRISAETLSGALAVDRIVKMIVSDKDSILKKTRTQPLSNPKGMCKSIKFWREYIE